MKKKFVLGLVVIGIIFFSLTNKTSLSTSFSESDKKNDQFVLTLSPTSSKLLYSSLTPHDPIEIHNDGELVDYGFPGLGTAGDPYIIENYLIETSDDSGIYIAGTGKYFVIRNCYIDAENYGILIGFTVGVAAGTASIINNTLTNNDKLSIRLRYSDDVTVINNTCSHSSTGIGVPSSDGVILINNTFSHHISGIRIFSDGATVTNNTFINNDYGIRLDSTDGATVTNNTFINNDYGIRLDSTDGATVTDNTFINDDYGVYLSSSYDATLINNVFFNTGLYIEEGIEETVEDYLSYTIDNNCVNDKLLGFYCNLNKVTFSEPIYGQLFFINCTEILISNQELANVPVGLYLKWCDNATISNNVCNNNYSRGDYGINLYYSDGATVTDNTCTNNEYGIQLSSSDGATVANNTCTNNGDGIRLGSLDYPSSDGATVTDNTCTNNTNGIELYYDFCYITYNLIQENEEYGVIIKGDSKDNIIHHNTFINNNLGGTSQASDWGVNNTWYEKEIKEGNYWSEWDSKKPYLIDGDANSTDPYPLNENLERINYESIILLPSIFLIAIIHMNKMKKRKKK